MYFWIINCDPDYILWYESKIEYIKVYTVMIISVCYYIRLIYSCILVLRSLYYLILLIQWFLIIWLIVKRDHLMDSILIIWSRKAFFRSLSSLSLSLSLSSFTHTHTHSLSLFLSFSFFLPHSDLDELCQYPGLPQKRQLQYGTKQMLAREVSSSTIILLYYVWLDWSY